jgi:glycosyl-4,4'-diaponeurosporenoate acyltransferase
MLVWNFAIIGFWHLVCFIACQKLPESTFDPARSRYLPKSWERGGRWYRDTLKINLWKDKLPQHIGKGDFSKRHLKDDSIEYLDRFILETCRGEWMHLKSSICALITLVINPLLVGLVAALFITVANFPFAAVQRYNRFRLQALQRRRRRAVRPAGLEQKRVTA